MKKINRGFVSEILLVLAALLLARYFFSIDVIGYLSQWLDKVVLWVKGL